MMEQCEELNETLDRKHRTVREIHVLSFLHGGNPWGSSEVGMLVSIPNKLNQSFRGVLESTGSWKLCLVMSTWFPFIEDIHAHLFGPVRSPR